jgi:uroporphyrinogen decarboxylase
MSEPLFLRACRGETVERAPLWIMRQAGRYLPEYRALRARHPFLEVCRTPELACALTLQPIARFGFDAAILFSDIMMPLESMGVDITFAPGPIITRPIASVADVEALRVPEQDEVSPYVGEAIKLMRQNLKVPLIGFAGAPLTLAAYLIEGKGSKDFGKLRTFLHSQPEAADLLMDKLALTMVRYLRMQIAAGAQAVQLFDSWAGLLDEATYRRFALPAVKKIMDGVADMGVPRIYFANDAAALLGAIKEVQADVLGVDWRMPLKQIQTLTDNRFSLQGNMDPAALFGPVQKVRDLATAMLRSTGGQKHIFNLGHGIMPLTPIAGVEALVETVKNFRA